MQHWSLSKNRLLKGILGLYKDVRKENRNCGFIAYLINIHTPKYCKAYDFFVSDAPRLHHSDSGGDDLDDTVLVQRTAVRPTGLGAFQLTPCLLTLQRRLDASRLLACWPGRR